MGMVADNAAEIVERSREDTFGALTDIRTAGLIELLTGSAGQVWINVDGVNLLRIQHCDVVVADTSMALSTERVV